VPSIILIRAQSLTRQKNIFALDEEMLRDLHGDADVSDLEDHDSVYSYDDDCFAALSEHGDAAYVACGEECDYESRSPRTLPFRNRLARHYPYRCCIAHSAPCPRLCILFL